MSVFAINKLLKKFPKLLCNIEVIIAIRFDITHFGNAIYSPMFHLQFFSENFLVKNV